MTLERRVPIEPSEREKESRSGLLDKCVHSINLCHTILPPTLSDLFAAMREDDVLPIDTAERVAFHSSTWHERRRIE